MAFGDVDIKLDLNAVYLGESTFNRLQYFGTLLSPTVPDSEQFVTDWVSTCLTPFLNCLSSQFILTRIDCQINQTNLVNSPTFNRFINQPGNISDTDGAAPFVSQVLVKRPENSQITPAGQPNFKNGYTRFAGVPQSVEANGKLDPAHVTLLSTFGAAALDINSNIGGGIDTFLLGMSRATDVLVGGNPVTKVPLDSYQGQLLVSTQSTRKFNQ